VSIPLCVEARQIITTSLEQDGSQQYSEEVVERTTMVVKSPFSERLLRSIIPLTPDQQIKLIRQLTKDNDKAKFKSEAEYLYAELVC
jgi:hypothetical protein